MDRPLHRGHPASGSARLGSSLHLPLSHLIDAKVQGALQLHGQRHRPCSPSCRRCRPRTASSSSRARRGPEQRSGHFLGGPLGLTGGSQQDSAIVIKLGGLMTADGLRKTYPMPAMQRLGRPPLGRTHYTGTVAVRDHHTAVAVDSTLSGLGVDLARRRWRRPRRTRCRCASRWTAAPPDEAGATRDEVRRIGLGNKSRRATCARSWARRRGRWCAAGSRQHAGAGARQRHDVQHQPEGAERRCQWLATAGNEVARARPTAPRGRPPPRAPRSPST